MSGIGPHAPGRRRAARLVVEGLLLFAFIPIVLVLYLRQPFGPAASVAFGLAIMFGHRFVAAPWMARHATERCLWCGRAGSFDTHLRVWSGGRERTVGACSARHAEGVRRFLGFLTRCRAALAAGIFIPLLVLLAGSLARAAGRPLLSAAAMAWQFKIVVAATVVLASVAYRTASPRSEPLRSPFPLHNFFLLGIRNTLWVFRIVGAWWLLSALLAWLRGG